MFLLMLKWEINKNAQFFSTFSSVTVFCTSVIPVFSQDSKTIISSMQEYHSRNLIFDRVLSAQAAIAVICIYLGCNTDVSILNNVIFYSILSHTILFLFEF